MNCVCNFNCGMSKCLNCQIFIAAIQKIAYGSGGGNDYITQAQLNAMINKPGGIAGLDTTRKLDPTVIPGSASPAYLGAYANLAAAQAAHPTANIGQYFYNEQTGSAWYWNPAFAPPGYHNKEIKSADYNNLTQAQKDSQPWTIIP